MSEQELLQSAVLHTMLLITPQYLQDPAGAQIFEQLIL